MAMIFLLLVCSWISNINAQPTLLPQEPQSVCPGESISYNCISNGTDVELFSPPIVNESSRFLLFSTQPVQTCRVTPSSASAVILVDPTENPSFIVTYTLYIPNEQSKGQLPVFCRVTAADGVTTVNTTFSVLGLLNPATPLNLSAQVAAPLREDMAQVLVNISWNSPANAEEFTLRINNTDYDSSITIRTSENRFTALLPRIVGNYSVTLCAVNRCGKICEDYDFRSSNSSVIAPAVVVGILGLLLFIVSVP